MPISWSIDSIIMKNSPFNSLKISTNINYNIKGSTEMFHVEFKDLSLIYDRGGNSLKTSKYSKPALRQFFSEPTLESIGSGFNIIAWMLFIIEIGLSPFKSSGSFWPYINMLQILSYLPAIDCDIPSNLRTVLTEYLGTTKSSLPFEYLPSWVPNPINLLELFHTPPINENFFDVGHISSSFIYNFSSQIWTLFSMILLYLLFILASRIAPKIK